jgi:hypothetical protein
MPRLALRCGECRWGKGFELDINTTIPKTARTCCSRTRPYPFRGGAGRASADGQFTIQRLPTGFTAPEPALVPPACPPLAERSRGNDERRQSCSCRACPPGESGPLQLRWPNRPGGPLPIVVAAAVLRAARPGDDGEDLVNADDAVNSNSAFTAPSAREM